MILYFLSRFLSELEFVYLYNPVHSPKEDQLSFLLCCHCKLMECSERMTFHCVSSKKCCFHLKIAILTLCDCTPQCAFILLAIKLTCNALIII